MTFLKVSVLARMAFGTSSEKKPKLTPGEDSPVAGGSGDGRTGGSGKRGRGQQHGARGHGRRDYSHLPTREEVLARATTMFARTRSMDDIVERAYALMLDSIAARLCGATAVAA